MDIQALIGQILATGVGGVAAWVAIRVDVALAKKIAEDSKSSSDRAHVRIDEHVERHHTRQHVQN